MPEMILPATYIEVRAESLIVPGPISIGNVGIVGTARRGRLGDQSDPTTVYTPSNIGDARTIFGQSDAFDSPEGARELTLIRALELAYANGAQRIFAARVATAGAASASYTLGATTGSVTINALASGTGYNGAELVVGAGSAGNADITFMGREVDHRDTLDGIVETWRTVPLEVEAFTQVINGNHPTYSYGTLSSTGGGSNLFTADVSGATGDVTADQTATPSGDGANGEDTSATDYANGLAALRNQDVHIIVLAGQNAGDLSATLVGHLEAASSDLNKRERIGVLGSIPSRQRSDLVAPAQDEGRLIFVGPGIRVNDTVSGREVTLPGAYAAAAVAGRISSLDPHASATNKTINAIGLETEFNGTELEQLLLNRVFALEARNGTIRIVRALTTSTNTAWSQITTRRIVDFARFGVRAAANPFIGKLNNERVRQALKGSINSLLADMVDREMLVSYELDVSATREQQIRGIVQVTMVLRPTFSIDFIRVVMYLE